MTRGKRRYLLALVEKRICPKCNRLTRDEPVFRMCWPCERAIFSEWMWNS